MRKHLTIILLLLSFTLYAQIPGVVSSGKKVNPNTYPIPSDLIIWEASTSVDDTPTGDGDFFWHNPGAVGIRASLHFDETAYSIETVGAYSYYKLYIDPDTPDAGEGNNNYRAEIQRHTTTKVPGTIRMVGSGFLFPEILNHGGEIVIGQWHTGTAPGGPWPLNSPVIYLGVAYSGQTDQYLDAAVTNELVVVNKVVDFEGAGNGRTNTGIVIAAGTEYFMRQKIKGGTGTAGRYTLQLKVGRGGSWSTIYDNEESTIWNEDDDGGSNSQVTPYWKLGIYGQNINLDAEVAAEKALNGGVYNITMYLLNKIKTADLLAADPYYNSSTVIKSVDTSN
jgi:hypothetical protein